MSLEPCLPFVSRLPLRLLLYDCDADTLCIFFAGSDRFEGNFLFFLILFPFFHFFVASLFSYPLNTTRSLGIAVSFAGRQKTCFKHYKVYYIVVNSCDISNLSAVCQALPPSWWWVCITALECQTHHLCVIVAGSWSVWVEVGGVTGVHGNECQRQQQQHQQRRPRACRHLCCPARQSTATSERCVITLQTNEEPRLWLIGWELCDKFNSSAWSLDAQLTRHDDKLHCITVHIGFNDVYSVLCDCKKAEHTVDHVKTYLFHGRDRRRVLLWRTCNMQTPDAINRHSWMKWNNGHLQHTKHVTLVEDKKLNRSWNKKTKFEIMLMRRARAYSTSCSQVILVCLHPFRRNHSFAATTRQKSLKTLFLEFKIIQGHRCWHS